MKYLTTSSWSMLLKVISEVLIPGCESASHVRRAASHVSRVFGIRTQSCVPAGM